jgi:hypothetical protein
MQKRVFDDATTRYTRISKREARKLWGTQDLAFCPRNLRPGYPWAFHCHISAQGIQEKLASEYDFVRDSAGFDYMVDEFEYYNCTCGETGHYAAFYTLTPKKSTGGEPCTPKTAP